MEIERVLVVGAGQMGSGIAQVVAQAGFDVDLVDVADGQLERAGSVIDASLGRFVKNGKLDAAAAAEARGRITMGTDLEKPAARADHVIEAIVEDIDVKQDLFRRLDAICPEHAIFATNTSQISISAIASATSRPDRFIGTHWFSPPPVMRLIEVIKGLETSDATLAAILALADAYGKEVVVVERGTQGFLTSRLILALNVEAVRILEEGIADADTINRACRLAFNHPIGPLEMLDHGGLETTLRALEAMTEHYGDRFRPPQILRELVNSGHYGRKTGRGFSDYRNA